MAYCRACGAEHPADVSSCPALGTSTRDGPCGASIGRYEIERLLGGGGMGTVYRARRQPGGEAVAIKLLKPELPDRDDALERFVREANAASAMRSPHLVQTWECSIAPDGTAYLVMELLEGRGLQAALEAERVLSPARAVALTMEVLEGLRVAHAHGVVHRDMKPGNVFLRRMEGGGEQAVVLDFGTSKLLFEQRSSPLTPAGTTLGTPYYMSPEQVFTPAQIDHRVDLYGTAVMLYQMLSGALPFEGTTIPEVLMKACSGAPVPLRSRVPSLPEALVDVVMKAMARSADARYQRAEDFIDALSALRLDGLPGSDPRTVRPRSEAESEEPATVRIERA
ncbi:MAG: serine/threonine protein kinase [Deltaproteobacteria bacterium]|nr:serine/threonine protein kinase [Deltaproteobacteria bacterium]MBK8691915.1 serine/threonine protein kinase [Deltaproteobacteria bacterium]MBP6832144.1 serine/threonine protein kinase [Deltaproteobacteria bacterium]